MDKTFGHYSSGGGAKIENSAINIHIHLYADGIEKIIVTSDEDKTFLKELKAFIQRAVK